MPSIEFYQFDNDRRTLNKKLTQQRLGSLAGKSFDFRVMEDCEVLEPRIILDYGGSFGVTSQIFEATYCYIPTWDRFYFINKRVMLHGNAIMLELAVDVMMSYKQGINDSFAFIVRNENSYNTHYPDADYPTYVNKVRSRVDFEWATNTKFDQVNNIGNDKYCVALTVNNNLG